MISLYVGEHLAVLLMSVLHLVSSVVTHPPTPAVTATPTMSLSRYNNFKLCSDWWHTPHAFTRTLVNALYFYTKLDS